MKDKKLFIAMAISAVACLSACKSNPKQSGQAVTETATIDVNVLATDSVTFTDKGKGYSCQLKVDFPKGDGSLDKGTKQFIVETLSQMGPMAGMNPDEKRTEYKGDQDNGMAILKFYGENYGKCLKSEYDDIKNSYEGHETPMPHSYEVGIRKTYDAPKYLTYEISSYVYLGGAHGSAINYQVNIDKETAKVVEQTIDTTKTKEMQPILRKGVIEYFKECGEDVSDDKLNDVLFINDNTIPLPACTPALTEQGLKFIYQQYEIGPYAIGMVSFTVPLNTIKTFMTKEAVKLME
ncbi:MAG: DUF3298 domain-containing protein [Prevotella sp.]